MFAADPDSTRDSTGGKSSRRRTTQTGLPATLGGVGGESGRRLGLSREAARATRGAGPDEAGPAPRRGSERRLVVDRGVVRPIGGGAGDVDSAQRREAPISSTVTS